MLALESLSAGLHHFLRGCLKSWDVQVQASWLGRLDLVAVSELRGLRCVSLILGRHQEAVRAFCDGRLGEHGSSCCDCFGFGGPLEATEYVSHEV